VAALKKNKERTDKEEKQTLNNNGQPHRVAPTSDHYPPPQGGTFYEAIKDEHDQENIPS
jgi:hypothetical protein